MQVGRFNDKFEIRTSRIYVEPFPGPLYTSNDRSGPFLFTGLDIAPYTLVLAFRDLDIES